MFLKSQRFIQWMAWRQLASRKGQSISFMTAISILGVAIGVAALVIVLSVMGGFERDLKSKMFRGLPHAEVLHENTMAGFSLVEHPLDTFEKMFPEAVRLEPYTQADVVIKRGKHLASLTLFGIDPAKGGKLWGFSDGLIEGEIEHLLTADADRYYRPDIPGIILGESLASQLGALVGDEIRILNPQLSITAAMGGGTFSSRFLVVGLFSTDLPRFDTKYGVVSLAQGRKFMADYDPSLDDEQYVTGIAMNMAAPESMHSQTNKAVAGLKDLKIQTWMDVNKSLLFALRLEKYTMGAILLLIVLVAAFSISGTMMMTVYHRRRYVATLRSLGMAEGSIARLFVSHGFTIGTIGVLLGLGFGLATCALLYWLHASNFSLQLLHTQKLPVTFLPVEYAVICGCAWALTIGAALYPALVAAKQDPGSGLRYS